MRLRLTRRARRDLEQAHRTGSEQFGDEQADRYVRDIRKVVASLTSHPRLYRERREFAPPVRVCKHKSHVIIYVRGDDEIVVVRVAHGREDWASTV